MWPWIRGPQIADSATGAGRSMPNPRPRTKIFKGRTKPVWVLKSEDESCANAICSPSCPFSPLVSRSLVEVRRTHASYHFTARLIPGLRLQLTQPCLGRKPAKAHEAAMARVRPASGQAQASAETGLKLKAAGLCLSYVCVCVFFGKGEEGGDLHLSKGSPKTFVLFSVLQDFASRPKKHTEVGFTKLRVHGLDYSGATQKTAGFYNLVDLEKGASNIDQGKYY